MKRRALLTNLREQGCVLLREGKRHGVYWNPANRRTSTLPRHTEVSERLIQKICKDLGIPTP